MSREPGVPRVERVFRNARAAAGGPLADLAVGGGRFLAVTPAAGAPAGPPGDVGHPPIEEVDLEGRVVLPGFIESHIHLDKAFLEERRPNLSGTLRDAIAITLELKRAVTREDIRQRSERALKLLLRHGTTRARLQVEVDPIVRLRGMEAALELREAWRGRFGLQLVVFPQEGIEQQPGTEGLMREAMRMGGDAVGGVPYNDTDPERHLDIVFKLAGESGKGVDLHLDFTDDPGDRRIESVCRRTLAAGLQGQVAVGHLTSLGAMDEGTIARIAGLIAEAGIHVLPLPATDLFLCGRGPVPPRHRSLTPVKALLRAGANVSIASNNIRNAFTPSGRGDLLEISLLLACVAHMSGAAERTLIPPMFTANAAKVLGVEDQYGIAPGKDADFTVLDTQNYNDIIIDQPEKRWVVKGGRVVVENLRETRWGEE